MATALLAFTYHEFDTIRTLTSGGDRSCCVARTWLPPSATPIRKMNWRVTARESSLTTTLRRLGSRS